MNDRSIIIGEMQGKNNGYFAMWANDPVVYQGLTADDALKNLFKERYPLIWYHNDNDVPSVMVKGVPIDGEDKGLGSLDAEYINRETKELICIMRGKLIEDLKQKIKSFLQERGCIKDKHSHGTYCMCYLCIDDLLDY